MPRVPAGAELGELRTGLERRLRALSIMGAPGCLCGGYLQWIEAVHVLYVLLERDLLDAWQAPRLAPVRCVDQHGASLQPLLFRRLVAGEARSHVEIAIGPDLHDL